MRGGRSHTSLRSDKLEDVTVDTYSDSGGGGEAVGGGVLREREREKKRGTILSCSSSSEPGSPLILESNLFSQHGTTLAAKTVPCGGAGAGAGGVCGQRRRQLVLLLGSISSVPSTAATNLSAAHICNGVVGRVGAKPIGACLLATTSRLRGRESSRALSLAAVTA